MEPRLYTGHINWAFSTFPLSRRFTSSRALRTSAGFTAEPLKTTSTLRANVQYIHLVETIHQMSAPIQVALPSDRIKDLSRYDMHVVTRKIFNAFRRKRYLHRCRHLVHKQRERLGNRCQGRCHTTPPTFDE